jgi:hypothetical protein
MPLDRVRYELKLAWKTMLLLPLALLVAVALLVLVQRFVAHQSSERLLLATVEMLLPTAAGIMVATTLAHDDALELHLTLPRSYARTGLLRVLVLTGWCACLACVVLAAIMLLGIVPLPPFAASVSPPVEMALVQLVWLSPMLWLVAAGLCLALATKSRTASGALLGGIWLLDLLFVGVLVQTAWLRPFLLFPATFVIYPASLVSRASFDAYWLTTRFELLGMAAVLLPLGWLMLRDYEGLLKGVSEE